MQKRWFQMKLIFCNILKIVISFSNEWLHFYICLLFKPFHLSIYLSIYLTIYLSIYLPDRTISSTGIHRIRILGSFTTFSIYLSIYLSIFLSIYLPDRAISSTGIHRIRILGPFSTFSLSVPTKIQKVSYNLVRKNESISIYGKKIF